MIPDELRNNPKLMRLHRAIASVSRNWRGQTADQAYSLMSWIDVAIVDWSRSERRRRKARKRRR